MISIGLVGCGVISVAHLNAYELMPDVEVIAVCDVVESLAAQKAKEYNVKSYYTSLDEMLRDEEIDLIDVCVPTIFHRDVSIKALEAGKHVICEKPIAATLKQADDMIEAAKRSNRFLLIGQSDRFLPLTIHAKKLLDSGELGKLLVGRNAHRFDNPYEKWMMNPRHPKYYWEQGGGPIIDSGIHGADLLNWFFGDEPVSVLAKGVVYPPALPFFTSAHIHVTYSNGGHGIIQVDRATKNYPQYERYLELVGTKKNIWGFENSYRQQVIVMHGTSLDELYYGRPNPTYRPTAHKQFIEYLPTPSQLYLELRSFIDTIRDGKSPPIKPEEARLALEICIAAEKSARSGKEIELPLGV